MVKWLRKYNTIILVIGGILLMIAFLLPDTIQQLGKTPLWSAAMRMDGQKVPHEKAAFAQREYYALSSVFGGGIAEGADHWLMLTHEAAKGGFTTGKYNGPLFLEKTARDIVRMQLQNQNPFSQPDPQQVELSGRQLADNMANQGVRRAMSEAHLTEDDVYRAIGKLHGVSRMRGLYYSGPRFSDRRLAATVKETDDAATVDYLFIPPDREVAAIANPDAPTLQAFFDAYKAVKPGEGEFGFGYLLPDRIKLAWLYIDRNAVLQSLTPNPVEVRKRFIQVYPTGKLPERQTEQSVMSGFETTVRAEQTEKVMRAIDVAIRAEVEKTTRKLDADGDYKKIPADWTKPDFERLRDLIPQRVKEATIAAVPPSGATIPPPTAVIMAARWLTRDDLVKLEGIGSAFIARGNNTEMFPDTVFKVRELAGPNESLLQVGIPGLDHPNSSDGDRYYFMVLDARKESAPDSIDEIKAKVVADYKRAQAFEILKGKEAGLRETAVSVGIETLAKSPSPDGKGDLSLSTNILVTGNGVANNDDNVNTKEFRKAVLDAAARLDPLGDITKLDLGQRTVVMPIAKSQGVAVVRITAVSPVTIEKFRTSQGRAINSAIQTSAEGIETDPFSLARLEERLSVEYFDGRSKEDRARKADAKKAESKGKKNGA